MHESANINKKLIEKTSLPERKKMLKQADDEQFSGRCEAEEALRENEERFRLISHLTNDIVYSYLKKKDGCFSIDWISGNTEDITGYTIDEIKALSCWRFLVIAEDVSLFEEKIIGLASGQSMSVELRICHKSGKIIWVSSYAECAADAKFQECQRIYGGLMDITKRKQAEDALRESEKKYRELFDSLPIALFECDLHGNATSLNPALYETFGYAQPDLKNGFQMIVPDEQDRLSEAVQKLLRGEKKGPSEYTGIRKDGSTFPFMIFPSVIIQEGNPLGFRGAIVDLTRQKQVQEDLRKAEEKYRKIIEQIEDGYFEVDLAGNFTFVNDAECILLGYSRNELVGRNNKQYQDKENAQKAYRLFNKVYRTGNPVKASDFEIIQKNGIKSFHEITVSLIKDKKGKPIGFRGLARDVTERRQAEEEKKNLEERLNRAEKMEAVGQLAGGVAHVLNNILGILRGYSELLLTEIPEQQKARGYVEKIMQSTDRGTLIIQDLLTLARGGVMAVEAINLNTVVSGFFKSSALGKMRELHPQVIFKTRCQENLLNIKGSYVHLEKMLMNLASNAAEAISGEGAVTIRTENRHLEKTIIGFDEVSDGDYAILIVSDTGIGITDEHIKKIFEPFYTRKAMGGNGTGLGLSIVWRTVKDHNGYIDVQTNVGEGTTFTLFFPAVGERIK
jgi:two-component system, cell cycle sensor histidine kinase and response regulator CckA